MAQGDDVQIQRALTPELVSTGIEGRAGRKDVIHQNVMLARTYGVARGECKGVIALEPRGETGFGYDPVFWVPEYSATMAQLGPEIKNKISHRARALAAFTALLRSWRKEQETGGAGSFMSKLA